jgi:hypothetical protein
MSRSITAVLHAATHQIPGVPAHRDRLAGHQGRSRRPHHHGPGRPPRVLAGWQRRIAAFFGQQLP